MGLPGGLAIQSLAKSDREALVGEHPPVPGSDYTPFTYTRNFTVAWRRAPVLLPYMVSPFDLRPIRPRSLVPVAEAGLACLTGMLLARSGNWVAIPGGLSGRSTALARSRRCKLSLVLPRPLPAGHSFSFVRAHDADDRPHHIVLLPARSFNWFHIGISSSIHVNTNILSRLLTYNDSGVNTHPKLSRERKEISNDGG